MACFALLFFVIFTSNNGQGASGFQFLNQQARILNEVEPEVDTSCVINQTNPLHNLYIICPTEIDCYLKETVIQSIPPSPLNLDAKCETIDGRGALPANKSRQLNAVIQVLKLPNENVCAFRAIKTLNAAESRLANMGQLGRANCKMDNASEDNGRCLYKLKFLGLSRNKVESLSNHSFCQFRQLEYLVMDNCSLKYLEADAFVDLVRLKEISLRENELTTLPVNLFANNIHLQMVDLNSNHLLSQALHAFVSINSLQRLFLTENQISSVDDRLTFPSALSHLRIFANNLRKIKQEYSHSTNLKELVLYNNSISQVDKDAFQNMRIVEYIDLDDNKIEQLHEDTFKNNLKLETLALSGNELSDFPRIAHLTNLKTLYLSNNKIRSVSKTDLINCTQLSFVNLFDNKLSFIENGAFDNIKRLEVLDLSYNQLTQTTVDLKSCNVLKLYLRFNNFTAFTFEILPRNATMLTMSCNQIETIEPHNFVGQKGKEWSLTHLNLSHNRIDSIKNLTLPPSIQTIYLNDNQISQTFSLVDAQNLTKLTSINVKNNNISIICQPSTHNLLNRALNYYISGNPLKCSCENKWLRDRFSSSNRWNIADIIYVQCQQMLPNTYFNTKTMLKTLRDNNFVCQSDHVNTDRCECPTKDNMRCEMPCLTNCTCLADISFTNVYFMCENRHLTRIPTGLKNDSVYVHATAQMFLSYNDISRVNADDLHDLPKKLIYLSMDNSKIRSIDENAFEKFVILRDIHLNNNLLQVLPNGLFNKLTQLSRLDLSNNRLTHLPNDTFSSLVKLKQLYLHNNHLANLPLDQFTRLNALQVVSLYNNSWSCDCAFIGSFKEFLRNQSKKVDSNKSPLSCVEDGNKFNISNFNMEHCFKRIELVYLDHSAIWIPSMLCGLLLMITVGLVFKWRYELQVLVYSRYGLRMLHKRQPEEDDGKQFDAFMAYNSLDSEFLVKQLLPGLEGIENPYRILIHERDFLAGGYISDNILEAVNISSRTIIVLTENFVQSGWCRLEFKTAHVQMLKDRCPRLLVIVVGDVPQTLEPEMQLYLKTNSYLRWGERLFWEKLYYAMPDRRVTTLPNDTIPMRDITS